MHVDSIVYYNTMQCSLLITRDECQKVFLENKTNNITVQIDPENEITVDLFQLYISRSFDQTK